jgi:hypothetical protein
LAFCLSVILVDLLVSLENEEREVKTKNRRKTRLMMKPFRNREMLVMSKFGKMT